MVLGRDTSEAALRGGLLVMEEVLGNACPEVMGMYGKVQLPPGAGEAESRDRGAAFSSAWAPGRQAVPFRGSSSRRRHGGSSWLLQMGGLFARELCPTALAEAFSSFSSSISPDQWFIDAHPPLLLCHPRLEVTCARAWQVCASSWSQKQDRPRRSLCLGRAALESFPPGIPALQGSEGYLRH